MKPEELFSRQHFVELSSRVQELIKQQSWWQLHGQEWVNLAIRLACFAASFIVFAQPGWAWKTIGILLLSYFYYGIGITGTHETSHLSFVRSFRGNRFLAYFFSDFWASQSNLWWKHRHVDVHHVYTNVPSHEPKIFFYPWLNKYVFFFLLPYLVTLWLIGHSINYLKRRWPQLLLFLGLTMAGWAFHVWLFSTVVSIGWAIAATFAMRSLMAPIFVQLAAFNHIGLEDPETRLPWLPHQTMTTRNLQPHWFLNGMGGNAFVECHIEHHVFPRLSNNILAKIRPITMEFLKKEGYTYKEETYWSLLKNCLKYYHELFRENPFILFATTPTLSGKPSKTRGR